MHYFPEDFQCIPQCLKNSFPKKYIFKAFDTVVFVVYLVLDVGVGLCPLPLSAWGPGLGSHQPDTQMPFRVGARMPGMTVFTGIKPRIMLRTRITGCSG